MITTILLLILYFFCFVTALTTGNPGFTSFYDTIMHRTPFNVLEQEEVVFISEMDSWLTFMIFAAAVLILINYFLVRFKFGLQHLTEAIVCICVSLSFAYYYYSFISLARYELVMNGTHIFYFVTAGASLLIAVFKIILLIRDHKGFRKDFLVFPVSVVLVFGSLFFTSGIKGYKICKEYSENYGIYGQEEHVLRTDLEESFMGNFANQAVDTDKGLFFLDEGSSYLPNCIKRLDSNGEISTVYQSSDEWLWTIGYDDGYLFVNRRNDIIRVDPDTGSCEEVFEPEGEDYVSDACVVDGKLYYVINNDKDQSIMVCEIDDGELSEAQLYISDINIGGTTSYDPDANLLEVYIAGEPAYSHWSRSCWQQCVEGRYRYFVSQAYDDILNQSTTLVIESGDGSREFIHYVDAYNINNGKIYYVLLTDHGFDICKCDLDGSNSEVLDSADLGTECRDVYPGGIRIMIGQGKIVVSGFGMQDQLGTEDGTIFYVTDLV